jgi:hypothetical protein
LAWRSARHDDFERAEASRDYEGDTLIRIASAPGTRNHLLARHLANREIHVDQLVSLPLDSARPTANDGIPSGRQWGWHGKHFLGSCPGQGDDSGERMDGRVSDRELGDEVVSNVANSVGVAVVVGVLILARSCGRRAAVLTRHCAYHIQQNSSPGLLRIRLWSHCPI